MKRVRTIGLLMLLVLLIGSALVVTLGRSRPSPVGFQAVVEMALDAQRDLDQVGKQATRISEADEMRLGEEIARRARQWWPMASSDVQDYVREVGRRLARHVRRPGIRYTFHVIDDGLVNAFALPGGQIFLMRGMLQFVETEAELAAVLGHEIAHVDLRHCIDLFHYELLVKKVAGAAGRVFGGDLTEFVIQATGQIGVLVHRILTMGYQKQLEFDADEQGWSLAVAAGYDPEAAMATFARLDDQFGGSASPRPPPRNPAAEIAGAIRTAAGSYFHSHPPTIERLRHLRQVKQANAAGLAGQRFYIGRWNLRHLTPRSREERSTSDEFRTY
ncbi:MAG: protease [Candidatus Ozemobacter sibiricus]|jgi:predicted Zn-dependent protease|uniref:Protease n=1 Tax=Candidatus Ozemobacter sibiricus TaxID=2268124 RepID=A0A367ZPT2_9BACT|nr:MAG: protease [Candidatus Ozemobacter sibiricus]